MLKCCQAKVKVLQGVGCSSLEKKPRKIKSVTILMLSKVLDVIQLDFLHMKNQYSFASWRALTSVQLCLQGTLSTCVMSFLTDIWLQIIQLLNSVGVRSVNMT